MTRDSLIAERSYRRCPDGDRPTSEPGGCECMNCGCIFIGAEWDDLCAVCLRIKATEQPS